MLSGRIILPTTRIPAVVDPSNRQARLVIGEPKSPFSAGDVKIRVGKQSVRVVSVNKQPLPRTFEIKIDVPVEFPSSLCALSLEVNRGGSNVARDSVSKALRVGREGNDTCPDLVDDISGDFIRSGNPRNWKENAAGFNNHYYWTLNNNKSADNIGTWKIRVDKLGDYEVFVYIPSEHATTKNTIYEIRHAGRIAKVSVSQADHRNQWFGLGTYDFDGKSDEYVRLTDVSEEKAGQAEIAFDAIGYVYREPGPLDGMTKGIRQWFDDRQKEVQQQFEQWLKEQEEKARREGERQIQRWIEEQCTRGSLIVFFPALLLALWINIRRVL